MDLLPSTRTKIERIASEMGVEVDKILLKYEELYNSAPISTISDPKLRQAEATRALRGQTLRQRASLAGAKACHISVLSKSSPRSFKSRSGNNIKIATAVALVSIGDKRICAPVGFWNEDVDGIKKVEVGVTYKTKMIIRRPKKGQLIGSAACSGLLKVEYEKVDEFNPAELVMKCIDNKWIKVIKSTELDVKLGHFGVLDATVIRYYSGEDEETGRRYANYTVVDEYMTEAMVEESGGITCWLNNPDDLMYGIDSHIFMFGQVQKARSGDVNFRVDGIVPVLSFPLTTEAEVVPDDDIMSDDLLDEVKIAGSDNSVEDNSEHTDITCRQVFDWVLDNETELGAKYTVLKQVAKSNGCNKITLDMRLEKMADAGIVFEPSVGYYKTTNGEWPDSIDDMCNKVDEDVDFPEVDKSEEEEVDMDTFFS